MIERARYTRRALQLASVAQGHPKRKVAQKVPFNSSMSRLAGSSIQRHPIFLCVCSHGTDRAKLFAMRAVRGGRTGRLSISIPVGTPVKSSFSHLATCLYQ